MRMHSQLRDDADRSEAILDRIPAGRWGTPEDMEGAVVYLASKAPSISRSEEHTSELQSP